MATNQANAICLTNTQETQNFTTYMNTCRTLDDTSRANNFFTTSIVNFKEIFQNLRAQYENILIAGDAQNSLMSLSGNSASGVQKQLTQLQSRKEKLKEEIQSHQSRAEASDRAFLDDIMHGTPKKELMPTLQDVSLGIFVFGWVVMSIVLVAVRWGAPDGNWRSAAFTFILLFFTSICVYSLLYNVV
jgi:gas vesicle protein